MEKIHYSAKFKRDYVAISAVVIFFSIVIAEFFLAVSIPLYVRRENVLALSVRKLSLIEEFDELRRNARKVSSSNDVISAEADLLLWALNRNADYLREYADELTSDEVAKMQEYQRRIDAALNRLRKGTPFSQSVKLNHSTVLNSIIKKSGVEKNVL